MIYDGRWRQNWMMWSSYVLHVVVHACECDCVLLAYIIVIMQKTTELLQQKASVCGIIGKDSSSSISLSFSSVSLSCMPYLWLVATRTEWQLFLELRFLRCLVDRPKCDFLHVGERKQRAKLLSLARKMIQRQPRCWKRSLCACKDAGWWGGVQCVW